MQKKILMFLIVLLILAVLLFLVLGFLAARTAQAPSAVKKTAPQFQGPTGTPYVKGPPGPPPSY